MGYGQTRIGSAYGSMFWTRLGRTMNFGCGVSKMSSVQGIADKKEETVDSKDKLEQKNGKGTFCATRGNLWEL